jgi:aldehyde:ferredoxin oxidoreductase
VAACLRSIGWHPELPVREQIAAVQHMNIPDDAMTVKGMPLSPWDPRGSQGLAVGFAVSPIGPHYDTLEHDIDFDPQWAWQRHVDFGEEFGVPSGGLPVGTLPDARFASLYELLTLWSGMTAVGVCIYAGPPTRELRLTDVLAMTASVTGIALTREEFHEMGRRRLALLRMANSELGVTSMADDLPMKFFTEPTANGDRGFPNVAIDRIQFERARDFLVDRLGWSRQGGITEETAADVRPLMTVMSSALQG